MKRENHPEITTVKNLSEIIVSEGPLKILRGGLMLFSEPIKHFTGQVEDTLIIDGKAYAIIRTSTKNVIAYPLYHPTAGRALTDLRDYLDVVIKNTPEESFFINVDVL